MFQCNFRSRAKVPLSPSTETHLDKRSRASTSHNDSPPILSPQVTATAAMELLDSDSELAMIADTEFQGISTDQAPELRLEFQHAMVKWHIHG